MFIDTKKKLISNMFRKVFNKCRDAQHILIYIKTKYNAIEDHKRITWSTLYKYNGSESNILFYLI